jgi:7-cyano-7-deazaguanine reductase
MIDSVAVETDSLVWHRTNEVTAHCPFEFGGPDFYTVMVCYWPDRRVLETKSLKEFLQSYRQREILHERLTEEIYSAIERSINPEFLAIATRQHTRGGMDSFQYKGGYK